MITTANTSAVANSRMIFFAPNLFLDSAFEALLFRVELLRVELLRVELLCDDVVFADDDRLPEELLLLPPDVDLLRELFDFLLLLLPFFCEAISVFLSYSFLIFNVPCSAK